MNKEKLKKNGNSINKIEYIYYPVVFILSILVGELLKNIV